MKRQRELSALYVITIVWTSAHLTIPQGKSTGMPAVSIEPFKDICQGASMTCSSFSADSPIGTREVRSHEGRPSFERCNALQSAPCCPVFAFTCFSCLYPLFGSRFPTIRGKLRSKPSVIPLMTDWFPQMCTLAWRCIICQQHKHDSFATCSINLQHVVGSTKTEDVPLQPDLRGGLTRFPFPMNRADKTCIPLTMYMKQKGIHDDRFSSNVETFSPVYFSRPVHAVETRKKRTTTGLDGLPLSLLREYPGRAGHKNLRIKVVFHQRLVSKSPSGTFR